MFLNLLLPYNIFLVWKQSSLRFSVYNSCYLFEYSADIIMVSLLPDATVHWAPRHGVRRG